MTHGLPIVARLLALALATTAARAAAGECAPAAAARARTLFADGERAFRVGELDRAAATFKAAYEVCPLPPLLFNLAQVQRQRKDYERALFFYRQYLATSSESDPQRAEVRLRIAELERRSAPPSHSATPAPSPRATAAANDAPTIATEPGAGSNALVASAPAERPLTRRPWFWISVAGAAVVVTVGVTLAAVYGAPAVDPQPTAGIAHATGF